MHAVHSPGGRSLARLEPWERQLIDDERVAHLGLLDDRDRPRVLPVTFAIADGCAWSAIDSKPKRPGRLPARIAFLRRRPQAALTVDRYDDDWERLAWVQILGTVAILEASAGRGGVAALAAKYPQYRDAEPPGPLLRLEPERVLSWRASGATPTETRPG
jgi:PPOX class probable F420-dependent enzyme